MNQSALVAPIVVHQETALSGDSGASPATPSEHRRRNNRRGRGSKVRKGKKKGRRREKKKGRGHGKKKKGRRRGSGRRRGRRRRKKRPGTSKNSTKEGRKRKNPRLPFRVPTVLPPTDGNITSDSIVATTVRETDGGTDDHDGTQTSPDQFPDDLDADDEEEQSSSSEMSLPKYLRHRGRRQLGEGGGIIQAPLLSACKPGAKRDYNYKCRPKFIPQERDRRRVTNVGSLGNRAPRPPRISCPEVSHPLSKL